MTAGDFDLRFLHRVVCAGVDRDENNLAHGDRRGVPGRAERALRTVLSMAPLNSQVTLAAARDAMARGALDEAETRCRAVLSRWVPRRWR